MQCPACDEAILLYRGILRVGGTKLNGGHSHEKQACLSLWRCDKGHEYIITSHPACLKCHSHQDTTVEPVDAAS